MGAAASEEGTSAGGAFGGLACCGGCGGRENASPEDDAVILPKLPLKEPYRLKEDPPCKGAASPGISKLFCCGRRRGDSPMSMAFKTCQLLRGGAVSQKFVQVFALAWRVFSLFSPGLPLPGGTGDHEPAPRPRSARSVRFCIDGVAESPSEAASARQVDVDPEERALLDKEWEFVRGAVDQTTYDNLCRLREKVTHLDSHPACARRPHSRRAGTLLRFLRARGGHVDRAAAQFEEAMDWRHSFQLEEKLPAWRAEWTAGVTPRAKLLRKYDFVKAIGKDREGCTAYLHLMGQSDPVGLVRELGDEMLLLHMLRTIEDQFEEAQQFLLSGRLWPGAVEVYDLGNYADVPGHMKRGVQMVPIYKRFAFIFDRVYPERIRTVFVVRAPRAFSFVWRTIAPVLPDDTRRKCRIHGLEAREWLEEMGEFYPPATIPAWLRSDEPSGMAGALELGGLVPENALADCS